jgi:DMSO reductase family type II enzyme heme b subunit
MIQAHYVAGTGWKGLLDPDSRAWSAARPEGLRLIGTPAGLQPSAAIRTAWTGKPIGAVDRVTVAAVHDGEALAFRLEWSDATENRELLDNTSFPDGAAVLLPAAAGASVMTMGAPEIPVNAWYWRADENGSGRHVSAEGLGTSRTLDVELVRGAGTWKDGRWRVVIARALRVTARDPVAQLSPGEQTQIAVAVWEGSHGERAGIKSFSGDWQELQLEPLPTARR